MGVSLYATNIGAEHLVGLSGDAYRYGLSRRHGGADHGDVPGLRRAVLFPYYIRNKVFTIPEFLELRYSRAARTFFSGLMLVICVMTKMAFCLYAGALVLQSLLGWDVMNGGRAGGRHGRVHDGRRIRRRGVCRHHPEPIMILGSR